MKTENSRPLAFILLRLGSAMLGADNKFLQMITIRNNVHSVQRVLRGLARQPGRQGGMLWFPIRYRSSGTPSS